MDDQATHFNYDDALDAAARDLADSITGVLSEGVSEAIADPLVQTVMAADRIDPLAFDAMLKRMAAKLARSGRLPGGHLCSC